MSSFLAIAFVVISQWPGPFTSIDVEETARTVWEETSAESLYEVEELGAWTCVQITSSVVSGRPECFLTDVEVSVEEQILKLHTETLTQALRSQNRLLP